MMSGPPIEDFDGGWADFPFVGLLVHDWAPLPPEREYLYEIEVDEQPELKWFISKCGIVAGTTWRVPALHEGNIPRCKNCLRRGAAG